MVIRLDDGTVFYKFKPGCTLCCLILASHSDRDGVLYFAQEVTETYRYIQKNSICIDINVIYIHNQVETNGSQKCKYSSAKSNIDLNFSFPTKK